MRDYYLRMAEMEIARFLYLLDIHKNLRLYTVIRCQLIALFEAIRPCLPSGLSSRNPEKLIPVLVHYYFEQLGITLSRELFITHATVSLRSRFGYVRARIGPIFHRLGIRFTPLRKNDPAYKALFGHLST